MKRKLHIRGFTLIELMVVISIIGILGTVGISSFQIIRQNGRDAKRQTDLKLIQGALEQFRSDQFYYPVTSITCTDGKYTSGCPLKSPLDPKKEQKTYLPALYVESLPAPYPQYLYQPLDKNKASCEGACVSYCLYAKLENKGPDKPSFCTNPDYNFAVSPP